MSSTSSKTWSKVDIEPIVKDAFQYVIQSRCVENDQESVDDLREVQCRIFYYVVDYVWREGLWKDDKAVIQRVKESLNHALAPSTPAGSTGPWDEAP